MGGRQRQGRRITVFDRERDEEGEHYGRWFFDGAHRRTLRLFETTKTRRHPLSTSYPLPWQSFTLAGGHRSSQWPSYPSTPATCPGNGHPPAATTRLLHRLHPTEENKHTPTNNRTAGGGYTPCLCTGYYTSTVCTPRVTLRPEIVPRSCKSSSTTTFLLTIAVSFLFHRILPLLANRDPLDHPSLPPLPPFVTDRGTEHSDSIQLGVERRRKIFLLDERLRSISISGSEDHFKLENSIF